MAFKIEGNIDVTVVDAYMSEPNFDAKENETNDRNELVKAYGDVCLLLQDKDGNSDIWHGEISNRSGKGTVAHLYRTDLTLRTLQEIGFNVTTLQELFDQFMTAEDGSISIPNLIGKEATVTTHLKTFTKRDGTEGSAIQIKYLNAKGGGKQRRLTMADLMARFGINPVPAAPSQNISQTPAPQVQQQAPQVQQQAPTVSQVPQQMQQAPQQAPTIAQVPPIPQQVPSQQIHPEGSPATTFTVPNCPY